MRGLHLVPREAQEGRSPRSELPSTGPIRAVWSVGGAGEPCGIKAVPTAGVGRGRESDQGCARVCGVMDDLRIGAGGGDGRRGAGCGPDSGTRARRKLKGVFPCPAKVFG